MFPSETAHTNNTLFLGVRRRAKPLKPKMQCDFHHKCHIVLNLKTPLQQQFDGEYSRNLNWFDTSV